MAYALNVIEQPSNTPEGNVEDHSFWKALERHMEEHVKQWEAAHPTLLYEES